MARLNCKAISQGLRVKIQPVRRACEPGKRLGNARFGACQDEDFGGEADALRGGEFGERGEGFAFYFGEVSRRKLGDFLAEFFGDFEAQLKEVFHRDRGVNCELEEVFAWVGYTGFVEEFEELAGIGEAERVESIGSEGWGFDMAVDDAGQGIVEWISFGEVPDGEGQFACGF